MDIQKLREKPINKIREDLDDLNGQQLSHLRALESAEEAPRSTLIKAIDDKLEELGALAQRGSDAAEDAEGPEVSANAPEVAAVAPEASAAAWQAPDYCGPMTGDQALWRVANLKAR